MNEKNIFRGVFLALLSVLGLIFIGFVLWVTRSLVTPTIAAALTAYMLFPLMNSSTKLGIPRWLTVIIIMTSIGAFVSITISFMLPIVTEEVRKLQTKPASRLTDKQTMETMVAATTKAVTLKSLPAGVSTNSLAKAEPPEGDAAVAESTKAALPKTDPAKAAPATPKRETQAATQTPPVKRTTPADKKSSTLLNIIQQISKELRDFGIRDIELDPEKSREKINNFLAENSSTLINVIGTKAIELGHFMMIFAFVLIFGLLDGDKFYKAMVSSLPNSMFEAGLYIVNSTTKMFGAYIRGVAIETVILGAICMVLMIPLMIIIKPLSFVIAVLITVIIALTNIVRIVGPIFGALAGAIIAFSTTSDIKALLGVLIIALIVQLFDNVLVLPLVMEGQMELHPVLCLLGVLAGGIVGGVLGMALAIPVMGGAKVLLQVLSVELHKFNYGSKPYYIYQKNEQN